MSVITNKLKLTNMLKNYHPVPKKAKSPFFTPSRKRGEKRREKKKKKRWGKKKGKNKKTNEGGKQYGRQFIRMYRFT
jgi:hypothetical protein